MVMLRHISAGEQIVELGAFVDVLAGERADRFDAYATRPQIVDEAGHQVRCMSVASVLAQGLDVGYDDDIVAIVEVGVAQETAIEAQLVATGARRACDEQ